MRSSTASSGDTVRFLDIGMSRARRAAYAVALGEKNQGNTKTGCVCTLMFFMGRGRQMLASIDNL